MKVRDLIRTLEKEGWSLVKTSGSHLFLLDANRQRELIYQVPRSLSPGGRFLFTARRSACNWTDTLTGRPSLSLGAEAYEAVLTDAGLAVVDDCLDEGENHYFDTRKRHKAGKGSATAG